MRACRRSSNRLPCHAPLLPHPQVCGAKGVPFSGGTAGSRTAAAVLDIETANTISDFAVKRVQRTADGHLELWVMADSKAPLGLHETIFWLNDSARIDTLVRPVRVTIDVVSHV